MHFSDIDEEVLFKPTFENDSVEELSFESSESDVIEEVLFANPNAETIDFEEPTTTTQISAQPELEPLFEVPEDEPEPDVMEETLFANPSVEVVDIEDDFSAPEEGDFAIVEEALDFEEPSNPDDVNEEVLFTEEDALVTLDVDGDSAVPEGLEEISSIDEVALFEEDKPIYIERNFARKMLDSDPVIIARYEELRNYLLSFKKVKSRISNDFDSFNIGRIQLAKLGVSQKSLKLYLNLEYETIESRLKCKFAGDKKAYASVPVFLRIKSDRAMRNAKYLIDKLAIKFELVQSLKSTSVNTVALLEGKAKSYE